MAPSDPVNPSPDLPAGETTSRYRSGAVARMVRMPVATLRIWERRYRLTRPATTATGHRLYSAADVQRLALLKQLSDLGHAIGSIAALDMQQLRQVAIDHARTLGGPRAAPVPTPAPWRIAVVGAALARRLQRPSVLRRLGRALEVLGPFDRLSQTEAGQGGQTGQQIDALLVHAPGLHEGCLQELQEAARALAARRVLVLYGFAAESLCNALTAAGVALLREPQSDISLGLWLRGLSEPPKQAPPQQPVSPMLAPRLADPALMAAGAVAPRRYDDATLADLAGLSATIACECPRHVAELLMQLSHFEAYSAECAYRSPADAALHSYLRQVAGASRAMFETALEHVAIHEGLLLPA